MRQVGRKGEGEKWCEYESQLSCMAWKVYEDEKAKAALAAAEEERRAAQREQMQARVRRFQAQRGEVIQLD